MTKPFHYSGRVSRRRAEIPHALFGETNPETVVRWGMTTCLRCKGTLLGLYVQLDGQPQVSGRIFTLSTSGVTIMNGDYGLHIEYRELDRYWRPA